jgi:hypothetical protein
MRRLLPLSSSHPSFRMRTNYPHEFRTFWGLDADHAPDGLNPDDWERYQKLDQLAKRVAELAASLVRPPKFREVDLRVPVEMREAAERGKSLLATLRKRLETERPPRYEELSSLLFELRTTEDAKYRFFLACLQLYPSPYLMWPRDLAERVVDLSQFRKKGEEPKSKAVSWPCESLLPLRNDRRVGSYYGAR